MDALLIEIFDGFDLRPSLPELTDIEMTKLMGAIEESPITGAADRMIKQILFEDFVKDVLGDMPAPEPASLPTVQGHVPSKKPNTGRVSARRQKLESLLESTFARGGVEIESFGEDLISHLLDSMESYIATAIREETRRVA